MTTLNSKKMDANDILRAKGPEGLRKHFDSAIRPVKPATRPQPKPKGPAPSGQATGAEDAKTKSSQSKREKDGGESDEPKRSQADILIECAAQAEFFHVEDEEAYARLQIDGHFENHRIAGRSFRRWLIQQFCERTEKSPGTNAMQQAILSLEARAFWRGEKHFVHLRIAEGNNCIYIDLCDDKWRAVEVTASGWRIVDHPPVRFIRTKGMLPLPDPVRGGSILDLRKFVNLKSKEDFVLLIAWLLGAFRADGPYPILALYGEQGTASRSYSRAGGIGLAGVAQEVGLA